VIQPTEDCLNGPVLTVSEPPTVLYLPLQVTDTDSIAELLLHTEGRGRDEYALSALRIGLLSLKHARGQVDVDAVRREGEKLLAELNHSLEGYRKQLHEQLAGALREYFDPNSGRLPERIERLIKKDGELEQALRGQIGSEGSELVRTLASFIGPNSVLMKTLNPADSQGLVSANRAKSPQHQQYTVAHELGHHVLHLNPSRDSQQLEVSNKDLAEAQAHLFAATWLALVTNDKEREDVLRQNPEAFFIPAFSLLATLVIIFIAALDHFWSRFSPARLSSPGEGK